MLSLIIAILNIILMILIVGVALGFVIFVHELGHFIVAKLCGVKCEKFYLGFDIGGWKLWKFRYGETEYGIGVLPLGGYVKMLGQEDNPARLKEELERAKMQQEGQPQQSHPESNTSNPERSEGSPDFDVAAAQEALYDPRSYLAKSVPKRMAIISAGVIMNVIFAFITAIAAYYIGVNQMACGVGDILPGEAAWRAGLRPGDKIIEINGKKAERFEDLMKYVAVGDIDNGVAMTVERPGVKEPLSFTLYPDRLHGRPTIGITNPHIAALANINPPYWPGASAARAKPPLEKDDRFTAIDGTPIESFRQLLAFLADNREKPLQLTVERSNPEASQQVAGTDASKPIKIEVPAQPMRSFGLVMTMGQIVAVQEGSPAATAGIKPNDQIIKIDGNIKFDGKLADDPVFLPEQMRRRAGESITLTVERKGSPEPIVIPVTLRHVDWIEQPELMNNSLSIPELGIAYQVLSKVERVIPGSPAEKAGMQPGMIIQQATISPPDGNQHQDKKIQIKAEYPFDKENPNWPLFFYDLQKVYPGSPVELVLDNKQAFKLQAEDVADWFDPDRGFIFDAEKTFKKAASLSQAVRLGTDETVEALTLVVRFLQKIGTQISPKLLGGPIAIAMSAGQAAQRGPADLLLFLTLLSANLAVLNILPIPVLDGGHLVFLAYEGIRGKPADERWQIALSILGLTFLVALMLFVIGMDISRLF